MKYLIILLLCTGCVMQLRAHETARDRVLHELLDKQPAKQVVRQTQSTKQVQVAVQEQVQVTKQTYGSMKKPYKTIIIDVYHETDVSVEQKQRQIAMLIAQLKQLQESNVKVNPKLKVVVRKN